MNQIRRFFRDTRGATMTEYIILVGMIALIAYAGFRAFGASVQTEINAQAGAVGGINDTLGGH